MPGIFEARSQDIGDGDRLVLVAHDFQPPRHVYPRQGDADYLTNNHPVGFCTDHVTHAGQAQQQPAALTRRIGAESHYPVRQLLAGQVITFERL
jgi:hypothetical protein